MKGVIFICLLSISMCLSVASQEQAGATQPTQTTIAANVQMPAKPLNTPVNNITEVAHQSDANATTVTANEAANKTNITKETNQTTEQSVQKPADTNAPNKTETAPGTKASETTASTEKAPATISSPVTPSTNGTTVKPDDKTKTPSTTPSVPTVPTATSPPTLQARAFDGPSFIGGIILTLGLLAVGFMGFKYYKKQHVDNYHTL